MLVRLLDKIPWVFLVPIAIVMGLAPFQPEPHLFEKVRMLVNAQLSRPIDIFDLFLHGAPLLVVFVKLFFGRAVPSERG